MNSTNTVQLSGVGADQVASPDIFPDYPPLPNERGEDDLKARNRVLYLHYQSWMDEPDLIPGIIEDRSINEKALAYRLPLGIDFQRIVAQLVAEGLGDEQHLLSDPNPEPLRRHMLTTPELRPHMPSPGIVTIRTRQTLDCPTGRIVGVNMNNVGLIPEAAVRPLVRDEAYREAWVRDGWSLWEGERDVLEDKLANLAIDRISWLDKAPRSAHTDERPPIQTHHASLSGKVGPRKSLDYSADDH